MTEASCKRTGNPCGTDTWREGYSCPCDNCQAYVRAKDVIDAAHRLAHRIGRVFTVDEHKLHTFDRLVR